MFAPICPLCCGHFTETTGISACLCGHAFHQNCVQSFQDLTKRFKGFRGCPACGGLKNRLKGGMLKRPIESYEAQEKLKGQKRHRHRSCYRNSVIQLRFTFVDNPPSSSGDGTYEDSEQLRKLLKQSEELNKRRLGEIKGLEHKLEALGSLLKTLEDQRKVLEEKLLEVKRSASSVISSCDSIFNKNNNRTRYSMSSPSSVTNFPSHEIGAPRLILSSVIQLATHALVDYAKSPAVVRKQFGRLTPLSNESSSTPYLRLRGIVSDSVINTVVHLDGTRDQCLKPHVPIAALSQTVSMPLDLVEKSSSYSSIENIESGCQTEFWYDSEWDEELYEVDWDKNV